MAAFEVGGVACFFHEISDVEESIPLKADIHKGGLHTGEDAGDFAVVYGACEGVFVLSLVIDLSERVVFDNGKPRFVRRTGYIDFFRHSCSFCPFPCGIASGRRARDDRKAAPSGGLGSAYRGCGQDAGCGSGVNDDRCEMLEQLCRGRVPEGDVWGDTDDIGDTRGCFKRQQACGVCDQNNLRTNLRRGRLPSGCNHISLKPVRPTDQCLWLAGLFF